MFLNRHLVSYPHLLETVLPFFSSLFFFSFYGFLFLEGL